MISFVVPIKPRPKKRPQHGKGYTIRIKSVPVIDQTEQDGWITWKEQ